VVVLELSPAVTGALLAVFSVLVFAPIRYIYPSRTKAFRSLNLLLTAIWLAMYATLLVQMPDPSAIMIAISIAYVVYYAVASMYLTWISPRLPEKLLSKDAIAAELED
jgi:phosphatidylcholine synthase